jgi:hypothetical protein
MQICNTREQSTRSSHTCLQITALPRCCLRARYSAKASSSNITVLGGVLRVLKERMTCFRTNRCILFWAEALWEGVDTINSNFLSSFEAAM